VREIRYPQLVVPVGQVEPAPRRVRATVGAKTVVDTTRAFYVWEISPYPQYYVPLEDVDAEALAMAGDSVRYPDEGVEELAGTVRIKLDAFDAWFEEEEQIHTHPRSPYARVDAIRSTRPLWVELEGVLLAESEAPVMVFETGLPPRYYLDRSAVRFEHLVPSDTVTACPYKGRTSGYWSVRIGEKTHPDLAWAYDFPTKELAQIAGMVAFFGEKVDISVGGEPIARPRTPFS
jgi:uncharacterized protein (DUF427 family)